MLVSRRAIGVGVTATVGFLAFFLVAHWIAERRDRLGVHSGFFSQLGQLLFQLVDEGVEDVGEHLLVVDDELQKPLHCVRAGRRGHSSEWIETAKLSQLAVTPQLSNQGRGRGMLKHHPGNDGVPPFDRLRTFSMGRTG